MLSLIAAVAVFGRCAAAQQYPAASPPLTRQANEITRERAAKVIARLLRVFGAPRAGEAPAPVLADGFNCRVWTAHVVGALGEPGWTLSVDSVTGALAGYEVTDLPPAAGQVPLRACVLGSVEALRKRALEVAAEIPFPPAYHLLTLDWYPGPTNVSVDGMPDRLYSGKARPSYPPRPTDDKGEASFGPELPGGYPVDRWSSWYAPQARIEFDVRSGQVIDAAYEPHCVITTRPVRITADQARAIADKIVAVTLKANTYAPPCVPKRSDPCTKVALEYAHLRGRMLYPDGSTSGGPGGPQSSTVQLVWTVQYFALEIWIDPETGDEVGVNR